VIKLQRGIEIAHAQHGVEITHGVGLPGMVARLLLVSGRLIAGKYGEGQGELNQAGYECD
jgi:hypothetical protein